MDMLSKNSVIALFDQHTQAENAVKELQQAGFDMKSLSIVGKDYHTDEHVVGYYTTADRMQYWGKNGDSGAESGACSLGQPSLSSRVSVRLWQPGR